MNGLLKKFIFIAVASLLLLSANQGTPQPNPLSFQSARDGIFTFDTGAYKGELYAAKNPQGLHSLIEKETDMQLAKNPGIFSFYRLLSVNHRWKKDFRERETSAKLLSDGALQIIWKAQPDYPVDLIATFRWVSPKILDLEVAFTPRILMRGGEVFLSSYFNKKLKGYVYADNTFMLPGESDFLPADVTGEHDFLYGTYLAFPRDPRAAQMIYDGRWQKGSHPVHFSVTRFYKLPMLLKKEEESGTGILLMTKPEDCFSLEMSYNRSVPDNIADHSSVYFSLFGEDLRPGQTRRAVIRMVIDTNITREKANRFYDEYLKDRNN
jgi:hypothetical protein